MHIIKRSLTRKLVVLTSLLIPAIFTGCGLWNNFTAYFNVYYNAAKSFDEAEKLVLDQKKNIFSPLEPRPTGAASDAFNKVIEKLSKLLQFNAESDLVDDALLMLGKSFYYQQDYQKALRKFTELIATYPQSDLAPEAQLWIGKTQLRLRNYTQATATFDLVSKAAQEKDDRELLSQVYVQQITYLLSQEKFEEAASKTQQLLNVSKDDRLKAAAVFELGKMYLKVNKPEEAAKAFAGVLDYDPSYDIEYSAKLQYGKTQRKLGNLERALNIFTDIEDDAKYDTYKDSTELQVGLTYLDMKRYEDAASQLALVDTSFKQSPNAGVAQFYLGDMMETHYADYDSAYYYYKKAMSSAAPQEFTQKAARKVQNFTKYNNLSALIGQYTKQLQYLENPQLYVEDSLTYYKEQALQDSLAKEKAKLAGQTNEEESQSGRNSRRGDARSQQQSSAQPKKKTPPVMPKISADSLKSILAKNEYELGSLFFTELNVPDSAYYYYNHVVTSYPNNPYMARSLYALGSYYLTKDQKSKADSLFEIIYRDYDNESIVNAAAEKLGKPVINLKYDAAEELFVHAEQQMKDSLYEKAVSEFRNIYHNFPKSAFAPKALYATGWIYENSLDMPDSAAAIYDSVLAKFPSTAYANAVRNKVQVFKEIKQKEKAAQDSAAAAKNNLNRPAAPQQQPGQLNQQPPAGQQPQADQHPAERQPGAADSLMNRGGHQNSKQDLNEHPQPNAVPDSLRNNIPQQKAPGDSLSQQPRGAAVPNNNAPKDSSNSRQPAKKQLPKPVEK